MESIAWLARVAARVVAPVLADAATAAAAGLETDVSLGSCRLLSTALVYVMG